MANIGTNPMTTWVQVEAISSLATLLPKRNDQFAFHSFTTLFTVGFYLEAAG